MARKKDGDSGIIYSTVHGKMCPACRKPITECLCKKQKSIPKDDGIVRVGRETKGRKGQGVTVITGIPLAHNDLRELAKEFKQKCGAGGTVKNGVIEIQGDHRDLLVVELNKRGYRTRRSGGLELNTSA